MTTPFDARLRLLMHELDAKQGVTANRAPRPGSLRFRGDWV